MAKECIISSCDLNVRIEIQRNTQTPDGQGGQVDSWTTIEEPWAKVEQSSASRPQMQDQERPRYNYKVWIRYTDISDNGLDRLRIDNKIVKIIGIEDIDRQHRWLKITCVQGDPT